MLNLLREYSKKSPYLSKFPPSQMGVEFNLKGLRLKIVGGKYSVILESRFWALLVIVAGSVTLLLVAQLAIRSP